MGLRSFLGILSVAVAFALVACDSDKAQKVQPETRGKRGETCLARNDCATGLACISGICSKNEFDIEVSVKHCDRVECESDEECCGDRPTEAPAVCDDRNEICLPSQVPGCFAGDACMTNADCNGGTCPMGTCQVSGDACTTNAECTDTCLPTGFCRALGTACLVASDCTYYLSNLTCSLRNCNCQNPLYDPTDPVCSNEDCLNVCNLRCDGRLCVEDDRCEADIDCPVTARFCDGGRCVQCTENTDCNEDNDETCERGQCYRPCEYNEECGMFEECQSGDCVYIGCQTDRECVLATARGLDGNPNPNQGAGDDARLAECLESDTEAGVGVCRIPCENDGNCGQFQLCEQGYCKFVGCDTDAECRAYLGIANEVISDTKPYLATAICTDEPIVTAAGNAN